jgi:hypothetical protein
MADADEMVVTPEGNGETSDTGDTGDTGDASESTGSWPAEAQAEYTRKTQALAEDRKQWETQRSQQTSQLQQYAQQLQAQQYARQAQQQYAQQQPPQQQAPQQTMLDQLRQMPYLDGATAAQLMERMVNDGINPLNNALRQRDQALSQLHRQYQALRDSVGSSQGKQAQQDLDSRFLKVREEQGLPDTESIQEWLRDVYYSHEGEPLDTEYPEMVRTRWEALKKTVRDADRTAAAKAKASPFPSRGGEASPTSSKTGGYKTPTERADELWPMMHPGQSE